MPHSLDHKETTTKHKHETHVVKKGETLGELTHGDTAALHATTALNHIENSSKIYVGEKVNVIDPKTAHLIENIGETLRKDGVTPVSENAPNGVKGNGTQREL